MDSKNQILSYLNDTYSIRNIVESFAPLNPEEKWAGTSALAPWSVESISINTGISQNDVMEQLEDISGVKIQETSAGGVSVKVVMMDESLGVQAHASHDSHSIGEVTVDEAMNLHVYQFVREKVDKEDRPVKIEEAIFDLKNNAFLPDDFMPVHLMGMVEGDLNLTAGEIRSSYSVHPDIRLFYLFHEKKGTSVGRVRFLYPAKVNFSRELPGNEEIREKLTTSFSGLRELEKYRDFENSRLLRTVIFNMEAKNTRELKRPVFDPRKIATLEGMGLAEKTESAGRIKDGVTVDQVKSLYADLKKHGEELSKDWLKSTLKLAE